MYENKKLEIYIYANTSIDLTFIEFLMFYDQYISMNTTMYN